MRKISEEVLRDVGREDDIELAIFEHFNVTNSKLRINKQRRISEKYGDLVDSILESNE
jgi:hypothetical protein